MDFFDLLQLIGGIILTVWYLPQIFKVYKEKKAEWLSLATFSSVTLGIWFMEIYAINLYFVKGAWLFFLITNTLALLSVASLLILIFKYKKRTID